MDGNKEMVALGTMNIVGSMTSCYVATGRCKPQRNKSMLCKFLSKLIANELEIVAQDPFLVQQSTIWLDAIRQSQTLSCLVSCY